MTTNQVLALAILAFWVGIALQAVYGGSWFVMSVLSCVFMITELDSGA